VNDPFQFTRFPGRLAAALRGLGYLLRSSPNARIHLLATAVAIGLAAWLRITRGEWLWITAAIGGVWAAEALNSAVETLADRVTREHDELIGRSKDLAAGAVLLAALAAAIIGLLVFVPRLLAI